MPAFLAILGLAVLIMIIVSAVIGWGDPVTERMVLHMYWGVATSLVPVDVSLSAWHIPVLWSPVRGEISIFPLHISLQHEDLSISPLHAPKFASPDAISLFLIRHFFSASPILLMVSSQETVGMRRKVTQVSISQGWMLPDKRSYSFCCNL